MAESVPWRWRLVGMLRSAPEFRGRDRLARIILGDTSPPTGVHSGTFGPGLRYEARYSDDGSLAELFFLQYETPSLVPVLETVLSPGGSFFDVGANIGVYAGWAARLVGQSGKVHAFEPVPRTRELMERFLALNELRNVSIVDRAVGASRGTVEMNLVPHASGLASAARAPAAANDRISVPMTSLDDYARETGCGVPDLIKIDVEGYEFEVLQGARDLLRDSRPPMVLFESLEGLFSETGVRFGEIVRWLDAEVGLRVFGLRTQGLVPASPADGTPPAMNSVAMHPTRHAALRERLAHHRFRRNQTC